jgi:hypothetical protein
VQTSRILDRHEYEAWVGDTFGWWDEGFNFGGEGVVIFIEQLDDVKVLGVDYGMQWPIDELTTIQVVD